MTAKMKRREFISLLGGAAAWPLAARAQQAERVRRIGVFPSDSGADDPLRRAMRPAGTTFSASTSSAIAAIH